MASPAQSPATYPRPWNGATVREVLAAAAPAHATHTAIHLEPAAAGETSTVRCSCGEAIAITAEAAGRMALPILDVDALLRRRLWVKGQA